MGTIPKKSRNRSDWLGPLVLALLLIGASMTDWLVEPYPLSDAHWDASIYLLRAKAFASDEQGYIQAYRDGAAEIYDTVRRGAVSTPFWSFVRFGQTVLMGSVVALTGTDEQSIHVLTWVYRAILSIGLFLSAMLPIALARRTSTGSSSTSLYLGSAISLSLYLLSAIAGYLSGNLVSEVPAIALIGLSTWSLNRAWEEQSLPYALLSGCAAFTLYAVRMESVWCYLAFVLALGWLVTRESERIPSGRKAILISAVTAALLFCVYSWIFVPLTDPRLFFSFAKTVAGGGAAEAVAPAGHQTLPIFNQLVAANGLLWVGGILGLPLLRTSRGFQAGSLWLLFALVPAVIGMLSGAGADTRVYSTLTPPLLLLSTLGWANFYANNARSGSAIKPAILVGGCVLLVLISQPVSYAFLRTLPGMWRLQWARQYLAPMPYQRVDFHLPELSRIQQAIAEKRDALVIVASPAMQGADHIMVIQYLTPSGRDGIATGASAKAGGGTTNRQDVEVRLADVPRDDLRFIASLPRDRLVLLVRTSKENEWEDSFGCCGGRRTIIATEHYALSELVRDAPGHCGTIDSEGRSIACSPQ